jgi:hypothetical protein
MRDIERTFTVLLNQGVDFVVIGGVAMYARGSAHLTRDLDICYERSAENIRRLTQALAPYRPRLRGAPEGLPFHFDSETVRRGLNFTLTTDLGPVDVLGEVAGLGAFAGVLLHAGQIDLFGRPCRVLSLDGLIKAKRASGRVQDLMVLPELEALREIEREVKHDADAHKANERKEES